MEKQDWGTILDWIRHLGRTSSQAIMSGNGMLGYARSLTQHELSMSLLSLSPAIHVRSQIHSRQDVTPSRLGTMTMHRRIQPEPQAQAPAANSNSPRAWCTPRAGHSRSPSRKVRALVLPPRAVARLDVVAAPVFLPWDWDCCGCGGEGTAQRHESEPLRIQRQKERDDFNLSTSLCFRKASVCCLNKCDYIFFPFFAQ